MIISFILWALGLLLIFLEFFVPGAILGILGGILITASFFFFASRSDSLMITLIYFICVAASIGYLIKFALWFIQSRISNKGITSKANQEGFIASKYDKNAIGKKGVVLSDLKPGGYILIDGKQHQAISQTGYIEKGQDVVVLGGEEESLLVKPVNKEIST